MRKENLKKTLFAIFVLALFLRLFTVVTQEESKRIPRSDAANFDRIAVNIASGEGFSEIINGRKEPTVRRTPAYPMFLAGIYALFGHSYIAVKIIQAILGALLCIIIFLIVDIIYDDRVVGVISAFLVAIYKPFVSGFHYYGGPATLLSEYLFMFFVGSSILTLLIFIKKENKKFGILSGIFIGLTILTRPEFALQAVILFFYLFYMAKLSIKNFFRKYFIVYLVVALSMTPWVIRNYIVTEKFVPLTTLGGLVIWLGNDSSANGGWVYPESYKELVEETKGLSDYDRDRIFLKKGIEELKKNPKRIPGLFIKKALVHWAPFEKGFELFNAYYAIILLLASIAILFFRRKNSMENLLLIIFLSTTLRAMIIWGDPRYRYCYEPYLIIFAALTINHVITVIQQRGGSAYGEQV